MVLLPPAPGVSGMVVFEAETVKLAAARIHRRQRINERLAHAGEPQPVVRSYPATAENISGLLLLKSFPVTMSWKTVSCRLRLPQRIYSRIQKWNRIAIRLLIHQRQKSSPSRSR